MVALICLSGRVQGCAEGPGGDEQGRAAPHAWPLPPQLPHTGRDIRNNKRGAMNWSNLHMARVACIEKTCVAT